MNNLIIAEQFYLLAKLMELNQENVFKVKAIANAANIIEKLNQDITVNNYKSLSEIKGIGKNILDKIKEILIEGEIKELNYYKKTTPNTVIELLNIKGLGPSKVYKLWKELGITTAEELIHACEKNQLSSVKGFGKKTQQKILENTKFYLQNKHKLQLGIALATAENIQNILRQNNISAEITGELRRHCEIINQIELITTNSLPTNLVYQIQEISPIPVIIHSVKKEEYYYELFKKTGSNDYLKQIHFENIKKKHFNSEEEIFNALNIERRPPFQRESNKEFYEIQNPTFSETDLIQFNDIKGIIHCHTQHSDGLNTVEELADFVRKEKFEYLAVCDHSQSATYANGLSPERIQKQFEEIDKYNKKYPEFKILKGIESDILKDGSLDYENDLLKQFDIIVASIHSHFEMTEEEATRRIIKAIENPYTSILGHLTGRLLLLRKGYPINHKKVIDACAANNVAIELNANTFRLDIDWRWLQYCMEKNVKITINPDAHEKSAIYDIKYGVLIAQKAGLTKNLCLNTYPLKEIVKFTKK